MKKIILLVLITIILIPSKINAETTIDTSKKIYDYADLLTHEEEISLYSNIISAIGKTNLDIVVVTINDNDKSNATRYAQDFYDYNDFGLNSSKDGIILLIDMDTRGIAIVTTGEGQILFDDERIDVMLDNVYYPVSSDSYASAVRAFINDIEDYFDNGKPNSNKHYYIDENGNVIREKTVNWIFSIVGALIIASIVIYVLISKHKMIIAAKYAHEYIDKNNVKLYMPIDTFLTTYTSTVKINTNSSSGGRSGGSSISRGSSGRSHGGGSRRF